MKKVLNPHIEAGSRESSEPRLLGSIVSEMLHSKEPLAKGFRQYIASRENGEDEAEGWHTDTALAVNLKTILRSDKRMKVDKEYRGVFRCDSDSVDDELLHRDPHYTFIEMQPTTEKRNPRIFNGRFITATRRDNGSLRLNFKELDACGEFSIKRYAEGVRREICQALEGLVEK